VVYALESDCKSLAAGKYMKTVRFQGVQALPEKDTFFRLQVSERVRILQVEV